MNGTIRPFRAGDYPQIAAIANAVTPAHPNTPEELRYWDEHRDAQYHFQRHVVECGDKLVGFGQFGHIADAFHPRKFFLEVVIHPEHQRQGIGSALYEHLQAVMAPFDPLALRSGVREDRVEAVRFAARRGFVEDMRGWESRLDVGAFDPTPFADAIERVAIQGIRIATLREAQQTPGWELKLYGLLCELERDVPSPEPYTAPSFESFRAQHVESPGLLPDGYFIAVDDDAWVGVSALWASQASADLGIGLTAVLRRYRRRGIATALKLRAIDYAKSIGAPVIRTWNESNNRPMLAINARLGFVRQVAWLNLVKVLKTT